MRTNNKQVNERIQNYILDNIDLADHGMPNTALNLYSLFCDEYVCEQHRKRYGSEQNMFREWLQGLPSSFTVECYHWEVEDVMTSFGLPNTGNWNGSQIYDKYLQLITREFFKLVNKERSQHKKEAEKLLKQFA